MKKKFLKFAPIALFATFALSCSDSDNDGDNSNNEVSSAYVFAVTEQLSGDATPLLLSSQTINQGSINTKNNGTQIESTASTWIYFKEKYLMGLTYNQGNAGFSSTYELQKDGSLKVRNNEFKIPRYTSYGLYDNDVITSSTGATTTVDENKFVAKGFLINIANLETNVSKPVAEEILSENYLGDGEYVTLAGFQQVGTRLFTAPIPMGLSQYGVKAENGQYVKYPDLVKTEDGGSNSSAYLAGELQWTQYPDQAYIAIYDGLDFKAKPTLVKTTQISYACGRFKSSYYQTIWADNNDDVYVFSPSYAKTMTGVQQTTLPAGVMRIKKGESDFDSTYYFNIEEKTDGKSFMRCWYIGGDYFLLQMYNEEISGVGNALKLAIFNKTNGNINYVTGIPDYTLISSIGGTPYMEGETAYIPITETNKNPIIYKIDAKTATATPGLEIQATTVNSVGRLKVN